MAARFFYQKGNGALKKGHGATLFYFSSDKTLPEIDNQFTFTLIKTTMRFKQIRMISIDFGAKMMPFYYYHFLLNNESQIFPEKH